MSPVRRPRTLSGGWSLFTLLLGASLASLTHVPTLAGQTLADSVSVREQEYRLQLSSWQTAVRARGLAETRFGEALNQIDRATDDDARESAQRIAWGRALEMQRMDARVLEVGERLDVARERLLDALDVRLNQLQVRLAGATTPQQRRGLDTQVEDLQNQYGELQREGASGIPAPPAYYPAMNFDPRDGRAQLEIKVGLLERKATDVAERLGEARSELERLNKLLRLQRQRSDSRATLDRFGDTEPPVGGVGNRVGLGSEIIADTTGVVVSQLPLTQQIELWESFIAQLEQLRDEVLERATLFRGLMNRGQSSGGTASAGGRS